jgi:hypothetical protein
VYEAAGELMAKGTLLTPGILANADDSDSESEEEPEPEPESEFRHGADDWLRVKLSLGLAGARQRAMESLLRLRAAAAVRDPTKLEQLAREAETEDERFLLLREKRSLEHEGFGRQYNARDEPDDHAEAARQPGWRLREHDLKLTQLGLPSSWLRSRIGLAARRVKKAKLSKEPRLEWQQYYAQQREVLQQRLFLQQRHGEMPRELVHSFMGRDGSRIGHAAQRLPLGIGLMDDAVTTTSPTRRSAPKREQAEGETPRAETSDADGAKTDDADGAEQCKGQQESFRVSFPPALASGGRADAGQMWPVNVLTAAHDYRTDSPRPSRPANTVQATRNEWAARNAAFLTAKMARSTPVVLIPAPVVELSSPFSSGVARATKQGGGTALPRVTLQDLELLDPKDAHFAKSSEEDKKPAAELPGAYEGARGEYTDGSLRLIVGATDGPKDGSTGGSTARSPSPRLPMMRPTSRPASPTPMSSRSVKPEAPPLEPPGLPAEHWPQMPPRVRRSIQATELVEEEALLRAWEKHQHAQAANPAASAGADKRTFKPSPTVTPRARAAAKAARAPDVSAAELECALRSVLPAHCVTELLEAARAAPAGARTLGDWGAALGAFPVQLSSISPARRPQAAQKQVLPPKWALGGSVPLWAQREEAEEEGGSRGRATFV